MADLLDNPSYRAELVTRGRTVVTNYDWTVVAAHIVRVYETVVAAAPGRVEAEEAR